MSFLLLALLGFLSAFVLSLLMIRHASVLNIMDVPNARSSHAVTTPRSGGIAIVLSFLLCVLPLLVYAQDLPWRFVLAMVGAGIGVAILGLLDDYGHVPVRWRLLSHFLAALWVLVLMGGLAPLKVFGLYMELGWVGYLFGLFYLVWLLNLYNFMDGINGIAGVEAVTVCLGAVALFLCVPVELFSQVELLGIFLPLQAVMAFLLACCVLGFLCWNLPGGRLFMGDSGSGFLGITFGVFSLHSAWLDSRLFWGWLILLGVFVVDATYTLIRRLCRGERIHQAHRTHAYQYAARYCSRHWPVSLLVGGVNLCWLLPLALLVVCTSVDGLLVLLFAYAPLLFLSWYLRAGEPETFP